jgi:hypothetical protein
MPSRPLLLAVLTVALAVLATGCSGALPADIFLVQRTGSIAGARLTLRFIDDGGVSCNGGPRKEITSAQLITARAIRRELDGKDEDHPGLAAKKLDLPPGAISTLSYRVRSEKGTVVFSDTSSHQPPAFYEIALLTRQVAQGACRLPR